MKKQEKTIKEQKKNNKICKIIGVICFILGTLIVFNSEAKYYGILLLVIGFTSYFGEEIETFLKNETKKEKSEKWLVLRHEKYVSYMQVLSAFSVGLIFAASNEFKSSFSQSFWIFTINLYVIAVIIGFIGFIVFRHQLEKIEGQIKK